MLVFETYDIGYKTKLPHGRWIRKNHRAKFSIFQN
jgi:hypothetical protein